jgi:hypothetical protein
MRFPRRQFLYLTASAAALPAAPRIPKAQAYPTRPVRIIVGFAAGGAADRVTFGGRRGVAVAIAETIVAALPQVEPSALHVLLVNAARWNVDRDADVAPVRALLDQGCDLEADVLPTVARMVPELPRPLKNWGAQWLVREIMAAPDRPALPHGARAPPAWPAGRRRNPSRRYRSLPGRGV